MVSLENILYTAIFHHNPHLHRSVKTAVLQPRPAFCETKLDIGIFFLDYIGHFNASPTYTSRQRNFFSVGK